LREMRNRNRAIETSGTLDVFLPEVSKMIFDWLDTL